MTDFLLAAQARTQTRKGMKALRSSGSLPAVIYGHGTDNKPLTLDAARFAKVWQKAGESSLVDLTIDDAAPVKVIIHDVQLDPRTHRVSHVDFHQVNMREKVEVEVPVVFIGESPAVKALGGTFIELKQSVNVECLPSDLIKEIVVDMAMLQTFEDAIHVSDLAIPSTLTVLDNADELIAHVEAPRTQEEIEKLNETVTEDVSQVEKVEKPKDDEETTEANPDAKEAK